MTAPLSVPTGNSQISPTKPMKILVATAVALLSLVCGSALAATLVIADENFDTPPESGNGLNAGNAAVTLTTTAGDPTASGHGNVGCADIEPGSTLR